MMLVRISDSSWIDQISEQFLDIHYGQISIRMSMDDFYILASMFDLSMGEEMPDDDICGVSQLSDGNYIVTYRSFTMTMCEHALGRFAELCLTGIEQLKDNCFHEIRNYNKNDTKWGHLSIVPTA